MNKNLGFKKDDKGEKNVKKNPLTTSMIQPKAKETAAGKSARLTTSIFKPFEQGDMDVVLQVHGMKQSRPVPAVATPIVEPEKPVYKIYADHVTIVNREEKTK